jgi:FMN-dependent NADH-azoreductase
MCTGKKAVNVTTRGGDYSNEPMASFEMSDRYLKTFLGFLGIRDYTTIAANKLDVIGEDVEAIIAKAIQQAEDFAKTF